LLKGTEADGLLESVQPSIATLRQVADTCLRPCKLCAEHPTYSALYCWPCTLCAQHPT